MTSAEGAAPKETKETAATAPDKKNWLWEFVNSQFGLWLLGSVVLSSITWYWNNRTDQRASQEKVVQQQLDDQRKDSEFLVSMLPYLSSKDGDVRLQAASVVSARYPEGAIPPEIQRIVAQAVSGVKANEQNQVAFNKVVTQLDNPTANNAPVDAAVVSSAQELPERVYMQIYDEQQREAAKEVQKLLREQNFVVPGIENVSKKGLETVSSTQVRYFNDRDKPAAEQVAKVLAQNGFPDAKTQSMGKLQKNPGVLEVWFKP